MGIGPIVVQCTLATWFDVILSSCWQQVRLGLDSKTSIRFVSSSDERERVQQGTVHSTVCGHFRQRIRAVRGYSGGLFERLRIYLCVLNGVQLSSRINTLSKKEISLLTFVFLWSINYFSCTSELWPLMLIFCSPLHVANEYGKITKW